MPASPSEQIIIETNYINEIEETIGECMLSQALSALESVPESSAPQELHDAFFEALEDCGRDSPWPDVELFEMSNGQGFDIWPDLIESFGMSYYEFQLLKHQCSRYAATYPSLDESTRDELLAPQRAHYARFVIDGSTDPPAVSVPGRYRDEWNELVETGW